MFKLLATGIQPSAFTAKNLFDCLLGLNETEYAVFSHVFKHPGECCEEIGNKIGASRSTVQRSMKRLLQLRLVERKQVIPPEGQKGYMYVYETPPVEELREYLLFTVEQANNSMREIIEREFS